MFLIVVWCSLYWYSDCCSDYACNCAHSLTLAPKLNIVPVVDIWVSWLLDWLCMQLYSLPQSSLSLNFVPVVGYMGFMIVGLILHIFVHTLALWNFHSMLFLLFAILASWLLDWLCMQRNIHTRTHTFSLNIVSIVCYSGCLIVRLVMHALLHTPALAHTFSLYLPPPSPPSRHHTIIISILIIIITMCIIISVVITAISVVSMITTLACSLLSHDHHRFYYHHWIIIINGSIVIRFNIIT